MVKYNHARTNGKLISHLIYTVQILLTVILVQVGRTVRLTTHLLCLGESLFENKKFKKWRSRQL